MEVIKVDETSASQQSKASRARGAGDGSRWWLTSPLSLALVALLGTAVGAVLQGFWNTKLEREKFEFSLINKALETKDKEEAARTLKFFADVGLFNEFNSEKIKQYAQAPANLPTLPSAGRSIIPPVHVIKSVLTYLKLYNGPINDEPDEGFVSAVKEFQKSRNVQADGVFGVSTFRALQDAAPDFFPDAWATRL
jgi:hypothetical protein